MPPGVRILHKRKATDFLAGELAAGEMGVNTTTGAWFFSADGVTITPLVLLNNASTADQTINANSSALLIGSTLPIPAGKLRLRTVIRYRLSLSKTAAGTNANTFVFQLGTLGTTGDADILTFTLPNGTAVIDSAEINITITIRGPLGASCIAQGTLSLIHNLSATGFATIPCVVLRATSAVFNSTTAGLIASLVCSTAASTVLTFQQVTVQADNL